MTFGGETNSPSCGPLMKTWRLGEENEKADEPARKGASTSLVGSDISVAWETCYCSKRKSDRK